MVSSEVRGQRDSGDAVPEQAALLAARERDPEIDELRRDGGKLGPCVRLLFDPRRRRRDERACRRHGLVPGDRDPRAAGAADPVENHRRDRRASER